MSVCLVFALLVVGLATTRLYVMYLFLNALPEGTYGPNLRTDMVGNPCVSRTSFREGSAATESSWRGKLPHRSLSSFIPMIDGLRDNLDCNRGVSRTFIIGNQRNRRGAPVWPDCWRAYRNSGVHQVLDVRIKNYRLLL